MTAAVASTSSKVGTYGQSRRLSTDYKNNNGSISWYPKRCIAENADAKRQLSNGMLRQHRILTEEEQQAGKGTRWMELEIHGKVRNLSPGLWSMKHLTALFLNGNHLARIPSEISRLCHLTLLDLFKTEMGNVHTLGKCEISYLTHLWSHNKLRSLPVELGDMISLCHLYLNVNQLRVLPYELGKLFRLVTLGLQGNPLSPEISKIYHEQNGSQKLLQFLLDHLAIHTVPPSDRNWIMQRQIDRDRPIATFTVLCYNVLCDKYATTNLYSYCPTWALNWEYRKNAIIKEIRHYEADIITLQEVETEQFRAFFQPDLESLGYMGIFSPKSRAKTMSEEERKYVDGCAIFWKYDKFEMEEEHLIEFTQLAIKKAQTSEHMLNRVMPKDNIALCAVLKLKEGIYGSSGMMPMSPTENVVGNPLIVCTAHIHWDPEFCDVKLVQSMMLVDELARVLQLIAEKYRLTPQQTPVLICGDLNSLPESGVFEYLSKGAIAKNHPDLKGFKDDPCLQKLSSSDDPGSYTHSMRLDSACDTSLVHFTNYTLDFKGMIDYIFSTPQSLCRLGILGPLDWSWIRQNKIIGFPHPHVSSDHTPIMAQYAVVPAQLQRPLLPIQHFGNSHSGGFGPVGR